MYNNTCFLTFCNGKNTCNDVRVAFVIFFFWFSFIFLSFPFRFHFFLFNFSSPSLLPFIPFLLFSGACLFLPLRPTLTKLTNSCYGHPISLLLSTPIHLIYFIPLYYFIALLYTSSEFLFIQSHPHSSPSLHTTPSNPPSGQSSLSGRPRSQSRFVFLYPFVVRFLARQTRPVQRLWNPNL